MLDPLVLDLDGSVQGLPEAQVLALRQWEEAIRFGCGWGAWRRLDSVLHDVWPDQYGTALLGSGDFHHLTHLLVARVPVTEPFDVVVLDNHPDNMRFPWGIHCGSWVHHVAALPQVRAVHVLGICSGDIGWRHAWENRLSAIYRGRVYYWSVGVDTAWANLVGLGRKVRTFSTLASLIEAFAESRRADETPVYLSIDKDVLSPTVVPTNWDQGVATLEQALDLIAVVAGKVIASDITGEVSVYHYAARWKRWLSQLDAQPAIAPEDLVAWQQLHAAVNRTLLTAIASAYRR